MRIHSLASYDLHVTDKICRPLVCGDAGTLLLLLLLLLFCRDENTIILYKVDRPAECIARVQRWLRHVVVIVVYALYMRI